MPFPIVGLGASAGGLVALEEFLAHTPPDTGMAFVIVQHLDPNRAGMLVELLQRHTSMPVIEIQDQLPVESNHVYVIPPGHDVSLLQGKLLLIEPTQARGLHLPIDFLFKSLAQECQQQSIGVILSGMGSDGTQGLRAIRQVGGACYVQVPAQAQFDGMPRSAIDAGVADVVARVEDLPARIVAFVQGSRLSALTQATSSADEPVSEFLEKAIIVLHTQTGHDFSQYKRNTLMRRIERRMALHQLARAEDYLRYLRESPPEAELLFNELLIGVTSFFRDAPLWEQLKAEVIPALLKSHPDGAVLRAWVPGCSTGEEAYSLAMVFREALGEIKPGARYSLQIFATDLDKDAVASARAAVYPRAIAADVSEARLKRFFVEEARGLRVGIEVREMVIFAEQNIINDPPFTKVDLLSCRNLMIYLEPALQVKLVELFHYSLNPDGFLVLGSAESIGDAGTLFAPLEGKWKIYRRLQAAQRRLPVGFPAAFAKNHARLGEAGGMTTATEALGTPNLQALVDRLVLLEYAPAAVLVTAQGEMLYFSGKTGRYLEPAVGKPDLNLFAMAREGLNRALSESFPRALREGQTVRLKKIRIGGDGRDHYADVQIRPLQEPAALRGMALVVFHDVVSPVRRARKGAAAEESGANAPLEALMAELQQAREDNKATREEMQTSQEELKSTNEELQSANEELQSTNEELTTSKEELQSMNEELQSINHEMQQKLQELACASSDMNNLLDSTDIATLFLDADLNIRRFTVRTNQLFKLIPGDTGRPITDITSELTYPELVSDAQDVLRVLKPRERDVPASAARWFKARVMPYRTHDNRVVGLVLTFSEITAAKLLEAELRAAQTRLAAPGSSGAGSGLP